MLKITVLAILALALVACGGNPGAASPSPTVPVTSKTAPSAVATVAPTPSASAVLSTKDAIAGIKQAMGAVKSVQMEKTVTGVENGKPADFIETDKFQLPDSSDKRIVDHVTGRNSGEIYIGLNRYSFDSARSSSWQGPTEVATPDTYSLSNLISQRMVDMLGRTQLSGEASCGTKTCKQLVFDSTGTGEKFVFLFDPSSFLLSTVTHKLTYADGTTELITRSFTRYNEDLGIKPPQ